MVAQIDYSVADQDEKVFNSHRYLSHLPDGANYGFVEIDMSALVSPCVFREFEKQINFRERHRQRKKEKEDVYAGNVDSI
jgi:hypothetical protein